MIKHPLYSTLNSHSKVLYNPVNLDGCVLALTKPYIDSDKWIDFSEYGNNGTIYGAIKNSDGFLSFDGINDYVNYGHNSCFNCSNAITIQGLIMLTGLTTDSWSSVVAKDSAYIFLQEETVTKLMRTYQWGLSPPNLNFSKNADWFLNRFINVAITFKSGGDRILYLNGIEDNRDTPSGTINITNTDFLLGAKTSGMEFTTMTVAAIQVYNYEKSALEILHSCIYPY